MPAPRSFAKRLRAFAKSVPKQQNEIKKALAIETVLQVVGDTPVDTGQARNNWITSVGTPDTSSVIFGPFGPAARGGLVAVNTGTRKIKDVKPGVPIHLTNNLPYIERLNDGHSKQAPRNFFKIAIERAKGIMRRQAIRYGVKLDG